MRPSHPPLKTKSSNPLCCFISLTTIALDLKNRPNQPIVKLEHIHGNFQASLSMSGPSSLRHYLPNWCPSFTESLAFAKIHISMSLHPCPPANWAIGTFVLCLLPYARVASTQPNANLICAAPKPTRFPLGEWDRRESVLLRYQDKDPQ